jgi:hypothetical protein
VALERIMGSPAAGARLGVSPFRICHRIPFNVATCF